MIRQVRALDSDGDWTFGNGFNNYISGNAQVAQNIQTRLKTFLGECFYSVSSGVDWFNFMGSKNETALNLAVSATILNTQDVTGILQLSINLVPTTRAITITYRVQTVYSVLSNQFQYNLGGGS